MLGGGISLLQLPARRNITNISAYGKPRKNKLGDRYVDNLNTDHDFAPLGHITAPQGIFKTVVINL